MDPLLFGENKLPYKIGTWMNHYLLRTTDQNPVSDIAIRPFTRAHLLSRRMISITSQHSALDLTFNALECSSKNIFLS